MQRNIQTPITFCRIHFNILRKFPIQNLVCPSGIRLKRRLQNGTCRRCLLPGMQRSLSLTEILQPANRACTRATGSVASRFCFVATINNGAEDQRRQEKKCRFLTIILVRV